MKKIVILLFILNIFANTSSAIVSGTIEKHKMLNLTDCIKIALENNQVTYILKDNDVKDFYKIICKENNSRYAKKVKAIIFEK